METILFYNGTTGAGAIGAVEGIEFRTLRTYAAGAFAKGWTHIAEIPLSGGTLLFYDANTRSGATGQLSRSGFATQKVFPNNSFSGWDRVVGVLFGGHGSLLFYDSSRGSGAISFDPTVKSYPSGSFATGWTHVIAGRRSWRVLFYNAATGAGALDFDPTVRSFPAGAFTPGWTHVAVAPLDSGQDCLLFYNSQDNSGAVGILDNTGFRTIRNYPAGAFGSWTHIIGVSGGFLFLHSATGAGAVARWDGTQLVTVKSYAPGAFSLGWTHILRSDNLAQFERMLACCWPLSVPSGEVIKFRTSTAAANYTVRFVRFHNSAPHTVTAADIENSQELDEVVLGSTLTFPGVIQPTENSPDVGCGDWEVSFSLTVPEDWGSGIYAAKCEDSAGTVCYVPFVVNPSVDKRSRLAVLANVTTWSAYNPWGGYSRYGLPGGGEWTFSFLRPNEWILNLSRTDNDYHYSSKHQTRGELWVMNWLQQAGYEVDVYTDLDLHAGIGGLEDYSALILSTHPEYWSVQMLDQLEKYLNQGGRLLYLGGNGIYDAVDVSDDWTRIIVYGTAGAGRTHMFRNPPVSRPEVGILGVAFPWSPTTGDGGNLANSRVPYSVQMPGHRFFNGTGVSAGDEIGTHGWCISEGSGDLSGGGASGWEVDLSEEDVSPAGTQILAVGKNGPVTAHMVYYDHPGGGFVFSVGSMSFGGSLVVDEKIQRLVRNVLDECLQ